MRRLLILLLLIPGCGAVPLAMLGSIFGLAGTAVSTGSGVYKSGKLDTSEMASFDELRTAVFLAADDLRLNTVVELTGKPVRMIQFNDDRQSAIKISLDPRTPMLTNLRIDVGFSGGEPTARLILKRVRAHLKSWATTQATVGTAEPE